MKLTEAARAAREKAYAPYSGYRVGAALESGDGRVFTGANIENAAYGESMCAERVALFKAVSEGARSFRRLAVVAAGPAPFPCGACRQALSEFGTDLEIIVENETGGESYRLSELFPHPFVLDGRGNHRQDD